jgi:hypothetical protein
MSRKIDILFLWGNYDIMDVARNDILIPTLKPLCSSKHSGRYVSRCITIAGYVTDWARAHNVIKHA